MLPRRPVPRALTRAASSTARRLKPDLPQESPDAGPSSPEGRRHDPDPPSLPPHKLRTLISLYHSAPYFPRPADLDKYIDAVFVPRDVIMTQEKTVETLRRTMHDRNDMPNMSIPGRNEVGEGAIFDSMREQNTVEPPQDEYLRWSSRLEGRSRRVWNALLGLEGTGQEKGAFAGLEVVREAELEGAIDEGGLGVKLRGKRPVLESAGQGGESGAQQPS